MVSDAAWLLASMVSAMSSRAGKYMLLAKGEKVAARETSSTRLFSCQCKVYNVFIITHRNFSR